MRSWIPIFFIRNIQHELPLPLCRRKSRTSNLPIILFTFLLTMTFIYLSQTAPLILSITQHIFHRIIAFLRHLYIGFSTFDWRAHASFRVTEAMKVSIAMSMALGVLLGIAVGLISGLEPAVVIGVSASMAMGCVFVMSFAVLHGVNALRAVAFAVFVSTCLPFGFGLGFGIGTLTGVFLGLEDPDDIREKTKDFVHNFTDFVKVVTAFTIEIL